MARRPAFPAFSRVAAAIAIASFAWVTAKGISAQQVQVPPQPPRDASGQPRMRSIPVGTASISGTVTTSDGGRPVRDARVQLIGGATIPEGAITPPGLGSTISGGGGPVSVGQYSLQRSAVTDASGRFSFAKLPAGHFQISVSKTSFLATNVGQKRPGTQGATIIVTDGQQLTANVTLLRGGVITGTIFGADGEPLARSQVGAWRYQIQNGVRRLSQNNGVSTDDRGVYRLSNLQPGDYLVSATPNPSDAQMAARMNPDSSAVEQAIASGKIQPPAAPGLPATVLVPVPQPQNGPSSMDMLAYLPTYHPGTPVAASAQMIHISGGDEHVADITVQYTEAGSIQGTISSPMKPGVQIRLSVVNNDPAIDSVNGTSIEQSGKFNFRQLAPGQYTVIAQTMPQYPTTMNGQIINGPPPQLSADDRLWGMASASVQGGQVTTVSIALRPGRSISGIVVFDMTRMPPDATRSRMTVTISSSSPSSGMYMGQPPQAVIEPDGRFTLAGVSPGRYTLRVNGGQMKSAMIGGVDTLDFPLEFAATEDVTDAVLTVTDKFNELSGTVTESSGKPGMDYTIIAAPTDDRFWTPNSRRIVTSRTGADGKYYFRSLPPGDYYVVVVSDLEFGTQYDPEFLRSLAGAATRVRVTDGKTTQDLRVK